MAVTYTCLYYEKTGKKIVVSRIFLNKENVHAWYASRNCKIIGHAFWSITFYPCNERVRTMAVTLLTHYEKLHQSYCLADNIDIFSCHPTYSKHVPELSGNFLKLEGEGKSYNVALHIATTFPFHFHFIHLKVLWRMLFIKLYFLVLLYWLV